MGLNSEKNDLELSSYRWAMLAIIWSVVFFMYASWLSILVIFDHIPFLNESEEYLIWTLPLLGLTVMALPGGLIVDKYGLKKTGIVGLSIIFIGTFCRGLSYNFLTLALSSCVLGFGVGLILPTGSKLISLWFGEKEIGTATGIRIMAAGLGIAIAQSISIPLLLPWLGSWQRIFIFFAFCDLSMLIFWIFIKEKPASFVKRVHAPFRESVNKVMRRKVVWMIGLIHLALLAVYYTSLKALHPIFQAQLANEFLADLAISIISYGAMIANIIMPILSDRINNRRYFILLACIILIPSLLLINVLGNISIWSIWIFSFVIGFMVGTVAPILMSIPIELKGVGHLYVAGASGLILTIGRIGGFVMPMVFLWITTSYIEIFGFIFLVILLSIAIILVKLIPETAGKAGEVSLEIE